MSAQVVAGPLLVALGTAVLTLLVRRWPRLQDAVSLAGVIAYAGAAGVLLATVGTGGVRTYQVGNWPAPFGISLVADPLAAYMLGLTAAVAVPALVYSLRSVSARGRRISYHALFHFVLVGVSGAFLTGDVFNLFVWFEVMLMASYVLVAFEGDQAATRASFVYLVLNLAGSAVMLLAIGGLYATVGTLNMADLARRLAAPTRYGVDPAPVLGLAALLVAVFALKAGIVPFQFWVPPVYRAAPAPAAAMLAGVTKKVGVYAIARLLFTVLGPLSVTVRGPGLAGDGAAALFGPLLFLSAAASVALGGVGAVGRERFDDVLSYSSISQVGFLLLPLAVAATVPAARQVALVATFVYALGHALAKSMLFLVAGSVESATGTLSLSALGGLTSRTPALAGATAVGLLALVGVPPLVGFFGKLFVFRTVVAADAGGALAVALIGAVFSIAYTTRAWNRGFWGSQTTAVGEATVDRVQLAAIVALAAGVVAVGLGFDPVYRAADAAAAGLLDWEGYVRAVLGSGALEAGGGGAP